VTELKCVEHGLTMSEHRPDAYEGQIERDPRDWLSERQRETRRTGRQYDGLPAFHQLSILGLGVAGESGEVADIIKKFVGHDVPIDMDHMKSELGDVDWYLNELCRYFGWTLEEVQEANRAKLRERYPDGFVPGGGNR
jgi:NTP pyrophosphatase (non-canonical NTP hydrolase)